MRVNYECEYTISVIATRKGFEVIGMYVAMYKSLCS